MNFYHFLYKYLISNSVKILLCYGHLIIHVLIHVCDPIPAIAIPENLTRRNANKKLFKYVPLPVFFFSKTLDLWLFVSWKEKSVLSLRFYLMFERYFDKHVLNIEFFIRSVTIIKDCKCITYLSSDDIL